MMRFAKLAGWTLLLAAAALLASPVCPQGLGKKGGKHGAPAESRPKVDEKAYKAALDRIPTPKKGYDPWGQMRPPEPEKGTRQIKLGSVLPARRPVLAADLLKQTAAYSHTSKCQIIIAREQPNAPCCSAVPRMDHLGVSRPLAFMGFL
jgi:hypothetical protein